jgi:hypothetical protein
MSRVRVDPLLAPPPPEMFPREAYEPRDFLRFELVHQSKKPPRDFFRLSIWTRHLVKKLLSKWIGPLASGRTLEVQAGCLGR